MTRITKPFAALAATTAFTVGMAAGMLCFAAISPASPEPAAAPTAVTVPVPMTSPTPVVIEVAEKVPAPTPAPEPSPLLNVPLDARTQIAIFDLCDCDNGLFCSVMAMACVESNFTPNATSLNGNCVGMMQINKPVHTDRINRLGVFDLTDPVQCAAVAIDYLKELMPEFGGCDSPTLYMAYNRGASGARTAIASGVVSDSYSRSVLEIRTTYLDEINNA